MDRRELLKTIALLTGCAFIGGDILTGCKSSPSLGSKNFSDDDLRFLDEVGETILPKTKTPGAKAAAVGPFMKIMVDDCYTENEQDIFHAGIKKINDRARETYSNDFMDLSSADRLALLTTLDKEAKTYNDDKRKSDDAERKKQQAAQLNGANDYTPVWKDPHYFTMIKQLTLLGFFTSKPGATEALRHVAVPAKYDGCLPYKKGDRAWA